LLGKPLLWRKRAHQLWKKCDASGLVPPRQPEAAVVGELNTAYLEKSAEQDARGNFAAAGWPVAPPKDHCIN